METLPSALSSPEHPLLIVPNRITAADFEGWVQERGLYFATQWDERYEPILSSHDPNEPDRRGRHAVYPVWKGSFYLFGICVVPPVAGRCSRGVPAFCQPDFGGETEMNDAEYQRAENREEPPPVPVFLGPSVYPGSGKPDYLYFCSIFYESIFLIADRQTGSFSLLS